MRKVMRCLAALVLCLSIASGALAEISLVPQMAQWDDSLPISVELSADVTVHMPFDDTRCAQLNALLKHLSLRLATSNVEEERLNRISVRVDNREALWMLQRETEAREQVKLSWQPDVTYAAEHGTLNTLLGASGGDMTLYGLDGNEDAWLEDGAVMMGSIGTALEDYSKEASIKTNIKNMGTARRKITYTLPKADAALMGQALADHCPEGELKDFLTKLMFSGQQKLILWLNAEDKVIRAEYAGRCGMDEESLRKVSLVWRMRRDDTLIRDDVTLKTPAVEGTDYNTLTCIRDIAMDADGTVTYENEFSYAVRANKEKTTLSGDIDLTSKPESDSSRLTGSITVKQQLPGEDSATGMSIKPDVLIGNDGGTPLISGKIAVQQLRGSKTVLEDAVITVEAAAGAYMDWEEDVMAVDASAMTEAQRTAVLEGLSSALVPHLVLLPQEDTLYLSADLPEDVWQRIVEAAHSALPEEVK